MTITKQLYLYINRYDAARGSTRNIHVSDTDPDDGGYFVTIGMTEVTFEVPEVPTKDDLTVRKIASLQKGRREVVENFSTELANIDEQLAELQALPCLEPEG